MASGESASQRVALIIGNANYRNTAPLSNSVRDAEDVAAAFTRLGFQDVQLFKDLEQGTFSKVLADFGERSENAEMAVIYFAGHGIDVDGQTYLLPVDSDLKHIRRVKFETQALDDVLSAVAGARKLRLILLDACRDNPFRQTISGIEATRSAAQGLAPIEPTANTLVAYAAKHGTVARDGSGDRHSPFTQALLDHLELPDIELRLLFGKIRDAVLDRTRNQQEPQLYGTLGGTEIFLKRNPEQREKSDIFISYARPDELEAGRMARLLQSQGWDVFWDQTLEVSSDWRKEIEKRLYDARCIMVLWSKVSINSEWVKYEAGRGLDKGILVPVSIDGTPAPKVFDKIQSQDLSAWDGATTDPRIERVLKGVRTVLARSTAGAPPPPIETAPVKPLPAAAVEPANSPPREDPQRRSSIVPLALSMAAIVAIAFAGYVATQPREIVTVEKPIIIEKRVEVPVPAPSARPATANVLASPTRSSATVNRTFRVNESRVIDGEDLETLPDTSFARCETACRKSDSCNAFTFDKWNDYCFLKTGAPTLHVNPKYVSGVLSSLSPDQDDSLPVIEKHNRKAFPTRSYDSSEAEDFDDCADRCLREKRCEAFNFNRKSKTCDLIERPAAYSSNGDIDLGYKHQPP